MEEAEYCNRLGLIARGELIALGTPATLRNAYPDAVIDVRCDRPQEVLATVTAIEGAKSVALFGPGLHVVASQAAAQTVVERIQAELERLGISNAQVEEVAPSMEDVFIELLDARDRAGEASP
jgi:ABC-2 type transport system ATP-binding protein